MKRTCSLGLLTPLLFTGLVETAGCAHAEGQSQAIVYEMKLQRACEAAIWAMPAVSIYDIELSIQRDLGGKFGNVVYFTKPMESRHGFLTSNDVTPYIISAQSTKDGPLVVELPPASDKVSFFGTFVDGWQTPIADVGPPGDDKGKGGKYLFLRWYNTEHLHSAIRFVTPDDQHSGREQEILAQRRRVYEKARRRNPQRWTGQTRNWDPVGPVILNPDHRQETEESINGRKAA